VLLEPGTARERRAAALRRHAADVRCDGELPLRRLKPRWERPEAAPTPLQLARHLQRRSRGRERRPADAGGMSDIHGPIRSRSEPATAVRSVRVLTVNTHKGFTPLNRRFILPELRKAVRATGADVVFLQEVLGAHARHARRLLDWPEVPHYEFLADEMWPEFAYGRNAVYPDGHHGNALLSKFRIAD